MKIHIVIWMLLVSVNGTYVTTTEESCKDAGYVIITKFDECKSAAKELGIDNIKDPGDFVSDEEGKPYGCFYNSNNWREEYVGMFTCLSIKWPGDHTESKDYGERQRSSSSTSGYSAGFCVDGSSDYCICLERCNDDQWIGSLGCVNCAHRGACLGTDNCIKGHKGYACGDCKDDWFLMNNRCRPCPTWGKYIWLITTIIVLLMFILIYYLTGYEGEESDDIDSKPVLTTTTIGITHLQITAIYLSFNVKFPALLMKIVEWIITIFSFDFISLAGPECIDNSFGYSERWWIKATLPFILQTLIFLIFKLLPCCFTEERIQRTMAEIMHFMYIFGLSTTMKPWVCQDSLLPRDPDISYADDCDGFPWKLVDYPDITCDVNKDKRWAGMLVGSIFLFLWYSFYNYCIYEILKVIYLAIKKGENLEGAKFFLIDRYKDECCMWEIIINVRKTFAVIAVVLMYNSGIGQASLMLVIILIELILQIKFKPYKKLSSNILERNLLFIQLIQLILTLICKTTGFDGNEMSALMLTVLFTGIFLIIVEFVQIIYNKENSLNIEIGTSKRSQNLDLRMIRI